MDNQLAVGDWVEVVNHIYVGGYVGYVAYNPQSPKVAVVLVKDEEGKPFFEVDEYLIKAEQLMKLELEKDELDLQTMIDMSLEQKDERWFNELASQLPLANF
jgi:hypothetical protein